MRKLILLILLLPTLFACSQEKTVERELFAMNTYINISAKGENASIAISEAFSTITDFEQNISRTIAESEISKLNELNEYIVSPQVYEIISYALSVDTENTFSISVAALTDLWQIGTENARVPTDEEIESVLPSLPQSNILLDGENKIILKNGAKIDLGGIGKGYITDKIVEIFKSYGIENASISLGGNVYVLGKNDENEDYKVGIAVPFQSGEILGYVEVSDKSVVTTGNYERYFEEDGQLYHHVFDISTGKPAQSDLQSVTIISDNSAYADILSTSLFVMGSEKALLYAEQKGDFEAIFVKKDNSILKTDGINFVFTAQDMGYTYE